MDAFEKICTCQVLMRSLYATTERRKISFEACVAIKTGFFLSVLLNIFLNIIQEIFYLALA